jgi:signal transduction histidine kinase
MLQSSPSIWRSLVARLTGWATYPWRLFQERTSVQLIAGYVAVVLMVILLFEITVVVALLWSPGSRILSTDSYSIEPYLGERSATVVQWLDPDRVERAMVNDSAGGLIRLELERRLQQVIAGDIPGLDDVIPHLGEGDTAHAAILDTNGTVIAASDDWISPGASVDELPTATQREVASRSLALEGAPDLQWNALYSMAGDGSMTVSAHPVVTSDNRWVGTFLVQGGSIVNHLGESRGDVVREISLGFLQSLWIFAIPALIVAIPFGYWRARVMSRRLQRLAGAAEAMAGGNLRTRVRVSRKDEIGRLAESFNDMAAQIDQNDRARRAFISNVSHELRTPVSIIQGTTERLISHPGSSSPEMDRGLQVIHHEGQMLIRLVEDLFTIARIEEHNLRLVRSPLDMSSVANEVVEGVRDLAWTQQKVSVETLVSPDLPQVLADRDRVRQIINNLVYNALRHTPEGGLVIIQARARAPFVEVEVSDTGVGIEPEKLETIFSRYYQTEQTMRSGEGSGLGLGIVQQLVKAHGGEISVRSKIGQGTTFCFTLPQSS